MQLFSRLEFREPWFLLAALSALPVFFLARRVAGRMIFSSLRLLPTHGQSVRARLAWLPDFLLAVAALSFGIALAGPRVGDAKSRIQKKGIAIMMVVDVSGSMRALDLSEGDKEQTRLDAVKTVLDDFVNGNGTLPGRPDDAIGLVSFARFADSRCPLTLDHVNLRAAAAEMQLVTDRDEDGTAIGDGLGLALERLKDAKAKSKVAILLTDGVNNAGESLPSAATELARTLGIKVYTIGAGTNGWAPVRVEDPFSGRPILQKMRVEIDEELLADMAAKTGGRYFRATDAGGLRSVYAEIDRLERTLHVEERFLQYREYFDVFTANGLILMALGWLLRGTVLRRLP